jgi:hypothetical protein
MLTLTSRTGRVLISGLVWIAAGSFAFGGQLGEAGDAAILQALAPELANPAIVRTPEDLGEHQRRVLAEQGIGFRFEGDFNSDGRRDLVLLGQHGLDRRRSFVLIATAQGNGWIRSGLLTFEQEFVVGRNYSGELSIFFCVGCDDGGRLEWTGSEYALRPFRPAGVR